MSTKPKITITTAHKLTTEQFATVKELITSKIGDSEYEQIVDESVLGGIRLTLGNQDFDATIAGKLKKLESQVPQAIVTTAVALTKKQLNTLTDALEKKYPAVVVHEVVDPAVLGGIKVTIGSREIDATLEHKLQQVRRALETT